MLVELGLVEQRYQAVLEVLNGATVTEVARRYGVTRQTVHLWLRRYGREGLQGLVDRSSKPLSCPHQTPAEIELRITELRRAHPSWGPRTIGYHLGKEGCLRFLPARPSIGPWFAIGCWIRRRGGNDVPITSAGSGAGRWSCGRWM